MSPKAKISGRLRVLIVTGRFPPIEYRAISQVAYDQAVALVQKGVEVTVLTQSDSTRSMVVHRDGMDVHFIGRPAYNVSSWELGPLVWSWTYWDYICSGVLTECFDVIHVHDLDFAMVMRFLAPFVKVPFVSHLHVCYRKRAEVGEAHFNIELAHYYQFTMTQAATVVITVSDAEKKYAGELLHCAEKTVVVPNGLRLENFEDCPSKRATARAKYELENSFAIMWGGRVGDWMKGPDIVGRAFSRIAASSEQARLIVAVVRNVPAENLGYLFGHLSEQARNRTTLLYPEDKEALLEIYTAADVFVMPSRYEPFGLMALEAMACGVPVIVSPNGGLAEIVSQGEGGLTIQWGDPEESSKSLAVHIRALMDDKSYREALSQRAKTAARRFDINMSADRLLDIYSKVRGTSKKRNAWVHLSRMFHDTDIFLF